MGIAEAAIVVAAVGAATTVYSTVEQQRAGKRSAAAQKEGADTAAAVQKSQDMEARREQIRKQRIRQAQIEQGAANQGVSASSGELGSLSALSTNTAASLALMSGSQLGAKGITEANQTMLNQQQKVQTWQAVGSIGSAVTGLAAPSAGAGISKLFGDTPSAAATVDSQVNNMLDNNSTIF